LLAKGISKDHLRRILAVVVAAGVAAAVFFLRRAGVLEGIPGLVFAVLLVLLLPLSPVLSKRIAVGGALFLGWMPLLWWVRMPVPEVDRTGIVLALLSGGLVLWVLWSKDLRDRAWRLVPQLGVVDAMPFVAGGLAAWTMWPFLGARGADRLIELFADGRGWDHVAHGGMVLMTRAEGVIEPMLGASPDGSSWIWAGYPQHPHTTVTSLIELQHGTALGDAATEFVRYGRGIGLLMVGLVVVLVAGVAQLPSLRRRPLFAWPLGALVAAAFLFGLGSMALTRSWWNFAVACAAAGLAALLAASPSEGMKPLKILALGGLVVAAAHSWLLLAPLALVAAAAVLIPWSRDRWPSTRRGWLKLGMVVVATLAAVLAVIPIIVLTQGGRGYLTYVIDILSGRFTRLAPVLATGGIALAVALAAYVRSKSRSEAARSLSLAAVPAAGFVLLGLLAVYQLAKIGTVSYYFDKLLIGVSLISVPVLTAAVAAHLGPPKSRQGKLRGLAAVSACVLASLAALFVFGLSGLDYRQEAKEALSGPSHAGARILRAAEISSSRPFNKTVYIAAVPGDPRAALCYYYQIALDRSWTEATKGPTEILIEADESDGTRHNSLDVESAAQAASELLLTDVELAVVVAPEVLDPIVGLLPASLRDRVLTWDTH